MLDKIGFKGEIVSEVQLIALWVALWVALDRFGVRGCKEG